MADQQAVAADPGDPDREHQLGGGGPAVAAGASNMAAERATLRRAAGQEQGAGP